MIQTCLEKLKQSKKNSKTTISNVLSIKPEDSTTVLLGMREVLYFSHLSKQTMQFIVRIHVGNEHKNFPLQSNLATI